ncbi:MAG: hypothetical protein AB7L71_10340 [Vicinamibacterales bacterium]
MKHILYLVASTLLVIPSPVLDQSNSQSQYLAGNTVEQIVASAELHGRGFPVDPSMPMRMPAIFASAAAAGTSERRCVKAAGQGPVRSGEFVISGELSGFLYPDPRRRGVKIPWSPLHHSSNMELLVRARRVGAAGEYRYIGVTVAHGSREPGQPVPLEEREYFFPSAIEFLHSGTWVVVATQASDWGCFVLTLPDPSGR